MKLNTNQIDLFGKRVIRFSLPTNYKPIRPDYFTVFQIYLTRGSLATPERRQFVENICSLYPEASITKRLDTPHNQIDLKQNSALANHKSGKRTLVFGKLKNAVRFSDEAGNTCPNY